MHEKHVLNTSCLCAYLQWYFIHAICLVVLWEKCLHKKYDLMLCLTCCRSLCAILWLFICDYMEILVSLNNQT